MLVVVRGHDVTLAEPSTWPCALAQARAPMARPMARPISRSVGRTYTGGLPMATVSLIHATPLAMPPVSEAFARELPEVAVQHLLDEGLLAVLEADGSIGPRAVDRMARVIGLARDGGAGLIQLTCSAYSPLVSTLRLLAPVPVLAIDDVLVETAVRRGRRIGLISTQGLTERALRAAAARAGVEPEVAAVVYRDAFAALARGDGAEHDRLLGERIVAMAEMDVIVLGQASMARVVATLPAELAGRVLTSPGLAVAEARRVLRVG